MDLPVTFGERAIDCLEPKLRLGYLLDIFPTFGSHRSCRLRQVLSRRWYPKSLSLWDAFVWLFVRRRCAGQV